MIICQTTLINAANQKIGFWESSLKRKQSEADELCAKSRRALFNKKKMEEQLKNLDIEIEAIGIELQRKKLFVKTLNTEIFVEGNRMVEIIRGIENSLAPVVKVFHDMWNTMSSVLQVSSAEQLSNPGWVAGALDLTGNIQKFQEIQKDSEDFIQHSLVSVEKLRSNDK